MEALVIIICLLAIIWGIYDLIDTIKNWGRPGYEYTHASNYGSTVFLIIIAVLVILNIFFHWFKW